MKIARIFTIIFVLYVSILSKCFLQIDLSVIFSTALVFCNGNSGNYLRNGSCIFVGTSKNWFDSRKDCIQRGGDLLVYIDEQTKDNLQSLVGPGDLNLGNDAKFWIGLSKWRWQIHGRNDGPLLKWSNFHGSVWGSDPQSTDLKQCIVMSALHDYQWIWVPCTKLSINDKDYPFLCVIGAYKLAARHYIYNLRNLIVQYAM